MTRRQGVSRAEIARQYAILIRHPFRRSSGLLSRLQSHLVDGDRPRPRHAGQHCHPFPVPVSRHVTAEAVHHQIPFNNRREVLPNGFGRIRNFP